MTLVVDAHGSYTDATDPGEPQTGEPRVSVTDAECRLLTFLAHDRAVLEIGTGLGVSTRALCRTAVLVTTVDIDQWVRYHVWPKLPVNACGREEADDGPYDLVFIDGDHNPDALRRDLKTAARVCPLGLIVVHDTNAPHIRNVCIESEWDWTFVDTHHGIGVALVGWDS